MKRAFVSSPIAILVPVAVFAGYALAACSGKNAIPPSPGESAQARSTTTTPTPSPTPSATATLVLNSGAGSTIFARHRIKPHYVSKSTRYFLIEVNGQYQSFPCDTSQPAFSCTFTVPAPIGDDTFGVNAQDANHQTISQSAFTWQINAGSNTVNTTLDGDVNKVVLTLANRFYTPGQASAQKVVVTALDVDGYVIVGPGNYNPPIALVNADTTGSTKLSATSVSSPAQNVSLTYTGKGCGRAAISSTFYPSNSAYYVPSLKTLANYRTHLGLLTGPSMIGASGDVWFAESRAIGRVTTGGRVYEYPVSESANAPRTLVAGPGGAVWFSSGQDNAPSGLGRAMMQRVNPNFTISDFPLPTTIDAYPVGGVAFGPKGSLWVTYENQIWSLSAAGKYTTEYTDKSGAFRAYSMVVGPDGNLWMSGQGGFWRYTPGGKPMLFREPSSLSLYNDSFGTAGGNLYLIGPTSASVGTNGKIVRQFKAGLQSGTFDAIGSSGDSVWFDEGVDQLGLPVIGRIRGNDGAYCDYDVPGVAVSPYTQPAAAASVGADGNLWILRGGYVVKASLPSL